VFCGLVRWDRWDSMFVGWWWGPFRRPTRDRLEQIPRGLGSEGGVLEMSRMGEVSGGGCCYVCMYYFVTFGPRLGCYRWEICSRVV
jgi:hypothetical protein